MGLAAAQLAGQDHLVGLDRVCADEAGAALVPGAGLDSRTAAGLARRISTEGWAAVETGMAAVTARMLARLPNRRWAALLASATIDLDTTDVEVYGRKKRGVADNLPGPAVRAPTRGHLGRAGGRVWARACFPVIPTPAQGHRGCCAARRRWVLRGGPGSRRAPGRGGFAIGAKRIGAVWATLTGISESDWTDAIDMPGAQLALASYRPAWWPRRTRLLIRRVALAPEQVSADPRSRRRRTLHPDQRALPLEELAGTDAVYGYSFI